MVIDFKNPYEPKEFVKFLGDFLPNDFEQDNELININDLSFKPDRIKKVKMIGNVPSLEDLHVYEIEHESESDPRVTLSRETFRLMSNYGVRKALAIFISRNSHNYRFSLVTIDLKMEGTRVTKDYSHPRRYSFFLGPDAKVHTPTEYLITKGRIKDLNDLQNRFSIEVVTKEFFSELSNWYFWALKNIEVPKDAEKEQNGENIFTIRLITRLIFIWFMKQKELIPENLFNNEYLKSILKDLSQIKTTYYKTILQNLFFATLNTPIKDRDFRTDKTRYGRNKDFMNHNVYRFHDLFINPEDMKSIFNNIPFLNGGLFECLDRIEDEGKYIRIDGFSDREDSQANVPNYLFFSEEHLEDLSKEYGTKNIKYKVRGIIDLLQTYNFTIDESTPVDVEIALDPELLGRVFENLLASYNPQTAATARKSTGSYYTPREIVDYMVTQSIKEYFKTKLSERDCQLDKKFDNLLSYDSEENPFNENETDTLINSVNNLKIIDPAVGSGAFPMGILQKLVLVLSKLDSHNEKWKNQQIKSIEENITDIILKKELIEKTEDNFRENELDYGRKLYLIQNCIFGVDIQPIAIQIAKLRFFISLLVDEKIHREQKNYGIEPLPNLELKFISANSLIGLKLKEESELDLKDIRLSKLEEDLKRIREIYFHTSDMKQKEKLRKEDKEIRDKISALLQTAYQTEDTKKIANWDPYNSNKSADWFDPEWMFGLKADMPAGEGVFDVVIANPPYLESRHPSFSDKLKDLYQKNCKSRWDKDADLITRGSDLLIYFFETSISFINKMGNIVLITQNAWLDTEYGIKAQKFLIKHTNVISVIDSKYRYFSAGEGPNINTVITVFKGKHVNPSNIIRFYILKENIIDISLDMNIKVNTDNDKYKLNLFSYSDKIISKYKWGILHHSDSFIFDIINTLEKRALTIDKIPSKSVFSFGQGLNLSKAHFIPFEMLKKHSIDLEACFPILYDGSSYMLKHTDWYLVRKNCIENITAKKLHEEGYKLFDEKSTRKKPPVLIMPRGISRHFCSLNSISAYSLSGVDVYATDTKGIEKEVLNLWCFFNSSLFWLIREIGGRKNLGGGLLKSEAADLDAFPVYLSLNLNKDIFSSMFDREAMDTLNEISSKEHIMIDKIIFDYLDLPQNARERCIEYLCSAVKFRSTRSVT